MTDYPRETESGEQGDKTRRKKDKITGSSLIEIRQVTKDWLPKSMGKK